MVLLNKRGKINFLRVHDVETGWGPSSDFIDVECVIMFPDDVAKGYGFQLRNNSNENAHKGMLDLLRDAFNHDWTVSIDYHIESGKKNGVIIRVMLLKSSPPDPETPEDPLDPEDPVDPVPHQNHLQIRHQNHLQIHQIQRTQSILNDLQQILNLSR